MVNSSRLRSLQDIPYEAGGKELFVIQIEGNAIGV